ncbi:MAG TPA: hypothetical protein VM204_07130 [Gaiellaceae bacterium]|nr:hypothetical protein [Gaiellaceae bacterium]
MNRPPPTEMLAHDQEPDSDGASIVMRVGFIVAGGVLAALASSLPASLRMGEEGSASRALEQWLVLSAVSTPLAVAAVAVLRRARSGLRLLAGERASSFAMGVLWWAVIELGLLSAFGALLRKTTHNHALAGVTFAFFAAASGFVVALFARRTTTMLARGGSGLSKIGIAIAGACAFLGVMLVGIRTSRAEEMHTAAILVDALALGVATTIASSRLIGRWRPMAIAGVPLAVLLVMVGLTTLRFDPKLGETLAKTAPLHSAVIGLFGS